MAVWYDSLGRREWVRRLRTHRDALGRMDSVRRWLGMSKLPGGCSVFDAVFCILELGGRGGLPGCKNTR